MPSAGYVVELVDRAFDYVLGLGDTPYARTTATLDLLASCPSLGRVYEPEHEAMLPPVECRRIVVPSTTVELFYYVDEARRKIKVIHAVGVGPIQPQGTAMGTLAERDLAQSATYPFATRSFLISAIPT